jgi:hypothetical protein
MTEPYVDLTFLESGRAHTDMATVVGHSGIYPSGEAHFFDINQKDSGVFLYSGISIFDFSGSNSSFSNGPLSRYFSITDFKIFNPYIHYDKSPIPLSLGTIKDPDTNQDVSYMDYSVKINLTDLMNSGLKLFNIYNIKDRNINNAS